MEANRREFLCSGASGLGGLALASMLMKDGAMTSASGMDPGGAFAPKLTHFAPRAKNCIFIFMAGAPSQIDLFDYKPTLQRFDGQKMPDSLLEKVRFAFIQKESATLMASHRKFRRYGQSGMWFSDLLPHIAGCADDIAMIRSMHTDQFNHHPGQLVMQCGRSEFGLPATGSWVNYGLGSVNQDLPGYIVLTAGRGSSGGATLWQSGFLPSIYAGVRLRNQGEPILNLQTPDGLPPHLQRRSLDTINDLNRRQLDMVRDPEIASRISNYELAYRMQMAAPELTDLSGESAYTRELYGLDREDISTGQGTRGGPKGQFQLFARNCLMSRRLVERGVRFVNLIHASWDHHSNLDDELTYNATMADQPIAALITDLKQRGLLDETLVVWGSEFGRTPLGENRPGRKSNTGRDHHPFAFSIFMAGGGVRGGVTYGETDDIGWNIVQDPVHANDFQATLLHLFGLDHERLTYRHRGADQRLTSVTRQSSVIRSVIS
jgi:hypothetical protein